MTPLEALVAHVPVNVNVNKATSMAFDARFSRLVILEPGRNRLTTVDADSNGRLDPSPQAVTRFQIQEYGLEDPQGIAVDPDDTRPLILEMSWPANSRCLAFSSDPKDIPCRYA